MPAIAVAGLSARAMAEAAARDGFEVLALDLFGDVDTCAVASRWFGIGAPGQLRIDDAMTLAALDCAAHHHDAPGQLLGWVPGGGFECHAALLAAGASRLPLLGTAPCDVARLRQPALFFEFLHAHDIEHPAFSLQMPAQREAWLLKDAQGCGGWHIRHAASQPADVPLPLTHYAQRECPGVPMSATFVANGEDAVVLGFNELLVRREGERPHVYFGVVGPVALPEAVAQRVRRSVRTIAAGFALRGLGSLDFILDGTHVRVLEVNPRCPASIELYADAHPIAAHVRACLHGELPTAPTVSAASTSEAVRGTEVVHARRPLRLDEAAARWIGEWPDSHDHPCAGQRFAAGDPLCSLSARGPDAAAVRTRLHDSRDTLLHSLETFAS